MITMSELCRRPVHPQIFSPKILNKFRKQCSIYWPSALKVVIWLQQTQLCTKIEQKIVIIVQNVQILCTT